MSVINNLNYTQAMDLSNEGDLIFTIKDNHVTAIRKVQITDYNNITEKVGEHIEQSIVPFYG